LVQTEVLKTLNDVATLLNENGCSEDHINLVNKLKADVMERNIFNSVKNQTSQIKYFETHFGLLMPEKEALPTIPGQLKRKRTGGDQHQAENFLYKISLLKQLERLLNFRDVYTEVNKVRTSQVGVYRRFEDGLNFKRNPLFKRYPNSLQVHLYVDEVQICNPTGSYNHKIVFVYFSLANLDAKYRSTYQSIFLLSMFYHDLLEHYDYNTIFRSIVDELKKLEDGVKMNIQGKPEVVRGTLTAIIADNLASHQVGGFRLGFSKGYRKCRTCLGIDEEIQKFFSDCNFSLRTREDHDKYCEALGVEGMKAHFSKLYGVNFKSVFNELKYFHVIGGMVPDIMHDLCEGIIPKITLLLLRHCIEDNKYFDLQKLNHIIGNFDYGHLEKKDKPSPIKKDHLKGSSFPGSATQKWLLFVSLPLMVGSLVNPEDEWWQNYCNLIRICQIVFSSTITNYDLLSLSSYIAEFLKGYKRCYPAHRITYKMHNLVHYPRFITELGPLSNVWCMRYEGKHAYFKSLQKRLKNWINLPYSLSYRHQQWICKRLSDCGENFLSFPVEISKKKKTVALSDLACRDEAARLVDLLAVYNAFKTDIVTIASITFRVNSSVLICPSNGPYPAQFALLIDIIVMDVPTVSDRSIVFVCQPLKCLKFDEHYQAFCVSSTSLPTFTILPAHLIDFYSYTRHPPAFVRPEDINDELFIVCKRNFRNLVMKPEYED
jgi:hypothetical protein